MAPELWKLTGYLLEFLFLLAIASFSVCLVVECYLKMVCSFFFYQYDLYYMVNEVERKWKDCIRDDAKQKLSEIILVKKMS